MKGLTDEDKKALARMADAIANKLLHAPLTELKKGGTDGDGAQLVAAVRRLFDLEAQGATSNGDTPAEEPTAETPPRGEPVR
jgi:hypothetical protein